MWTFLGIIKRKIWIYGRAMILIDSCWWFFKPWDVAASYLLLEQKLSTCCSLFAYLGFYVGSPKLQGACFAKLVMVQISATGQWTRLQDLTITRTISCWEAFWLQWRGLFQLTKKLLCLPWIPSILSHMGFWYF